MATAKYESEDVTIIFEAPLSKNDYGVRGSEFYEVDYDAAEITTIEIMGVEYSESDLPPLMRASLWEKLQEVEFD